LQRVRKHQELTVNRDVLLFTKSQFNNNLDVIARHSNYQRKLFSLSQSRSNLTISRSIFAVCEKHSITNRCNCFGVISVADPFLSYLKFALIGKLRFKQFKLQVQCHGDFGDEDWQKLNFKNFVYSKLARRALKRADQIRCVGKSQSEKIISSYGIDQTKIVIAPIPTKNEDLLPPWDRPLTPVVAFLGRLHKERSIQVWAEIAREIYLMNKNVKFFIIGDGPERKNFENLLLEIPHTQFTFSGKMLNKEALKLLSKSSVLLSTASFESYGMAMVEAAKIGLPIVSKPTSGVLDLSAAYNSIFIGDTPKELANLTLAALNQEERGVITGPEFLKSESESVDAIVDAWLKLL
jgi:glycosyltransferase involved in cell wall biosynthesis